MRIGLAGDHGGFELKQKLSESIKSQGHQVRDFGSFQLDPKDDYPDFVIPLARAVAQNEVDRGIAICGSGVGAAIAASKVPGARASLIHDLFSARQGVEDDNMNIMCLGGRVDGFAFAWELVKIFLDAKFKAEERHLRRLAKVTALDRKEPSP